MTHTRPYHFSRAALLTFVGVVALLLYAAPLSACQVPVFRYALERWQPGAFQVLIFHDGKLTKEHEAALKLLRDAALNAKKPAANFVVLGPVNIERDASAEARRLFAKIAAGRPTSLPLMAVFYPDGSAGISPFWTAPLTEATAKALIDSPARREIVRRIAQRETAVYVFLPTGDEKSDSQARRRLESDLARIAAKRNLSAELPAVCGGLTSLLGIPSGHAPLLGVATLGHDTCGSRIVELIDRLNGPVLPLPLRFSVLTVQRDDPAEEFFVKSLLHSEPDLPGQPSLVKLKEPMAFAVFGRGRARFGLVGDGINSDTIADDVAFLTGPCTCTIKEQNPGFDLLLAADWDAIIGERLVQDRELPSLTGLGGPRVPDVHDADPPEATNLVKLDREKDLWKQTLDDLKKPTDPAHHALAARKKAEAAKQASTRPLPDAGASGPESVKGSGATGMQGADAAKPAEVPAADAMGDALFRNTVIALVAGIVIVGAAYLLARRRSA